MTSNLTSLSSFRTYNKNKNDVTKCLLYFYKGFLKALLFVFVLTSAVLY